MTDLLLASLSLDRQVWLNLSICIKMGTSVTALFNWNTFSIEDIHVIRYNTIFITNSIGDNDNT